MQNMQNMQKYAKYAKICKIWRFSKMNMKCGLNQELEQY